MTGETEYIFGKPTEAEARAFMFATTNENVNSLVPVDIQNRIIELVESDSPMLDDAEMSNMTRGFGVPRHKSIDAGDAKGVAEGTANEDEEDTFDLITMDGIEIKKHLVITRKMQFQSISAFEDWVTTHLATRIRVAKERVIMARLDGTAPEAGTINAELGIAAGNKLTGKAYEDADIRSVFAKLKGTGARVVYANNATIWNHLAGMENAKGDKLFTPNSMVDPIVAGRIYGAEVKVDNNLGDNIVYFGVKRGVKANNFDDLTIHSAIEPKNAYDAEILALQEAALLDLKIAGVITESMDALIRRAVVTYCRMNFGSPEDYDRLKRSYDEQKAQLMMADGYTDWGGAHET